MSRVRWCFLVLELGVIVACLYLIQHHAPEFPRLSTQTECCPVRAEIDEGEG